MREQDLLAALFGDLADGGRDALDARQVGRLAFFHGHVEVDADEHALAPDVGLIEGAKHPGRHGHVVQDGQISLPIATAVSTMRFEKPHSLSYQDITRTSVPSITLVWSMANTDEWLSWLKAMETLGASV